MEEMLLIRMYITSWCNHNLSLNYRFHHSYTTLWDILKLLALNVGQSKFFIKATLLKSITPTLCFCNVSLTFSLRWSFCLCWFIVFSAFSTRLRNFSSCTANSSLTSLIGAMAWICYKKIRPFKQKLLCNVFNGSSHVE